MVKHAQPKNNAGSRRAGVQLARTFIERLGAVRLLWPLAKRAPALLAYRSFPRRSEQLLQSFCGDGLLIESHYQDLFRYFAQGWQTYRTPRGEGAIYPGLPSWSGSQVDRLEGFSRLMPLLGAWCSSGRGQELQLSGGATISLPEEFDRGLTAGTAPDSPVYWGDMPGRSNQRIVEAADIALALWLFRDTVWRSMPQARRAAVVRWLSLVDGHPGLDNNWHLFFVMIDRVLAALGYPGQIPSARDHFERIKSFHLGDGWFRDGPNGRVDYYSAWGFHYALSWIDLIDPEWDPAFIRPCQRQFLAGFKHLIGPRGFPVLGRSVGYRMAVAAPLVFGQATHPDLVSAGEARRALDCTWRYFIRRGAVRYGTVTQGYFGPDARVLDAYSGPASSLWSLRSLVAALHLPRDSAFWRTSGEPLPVERGDYELTFAGAEWKVRGENRTGTVSIEVLSNLPESEPALRSVGRLQTLRSIAYGEPMRPKNDEAKYLRRHYRSDPPFCI